MPKDADWISAFSALSHLPQADRDVLSAEGREITAKQGEVMFGPGKAPEHLLLLVSGSVRVHQISEQGREIVLFRVHAGESCVLTTACLLAFEDYSAEGIAETDIRAIAIPRQTFDRLVATSEDFRRFVFATYSKRITDLFLVVEEIAFQRMDIRLAQKLEELAGEADVVKATHQQLATELGTAREVVSRQLQEFQRRGWVAQSRGTITLMNRAEMHQLAETPA